MQRVALHERVGGLLYISNRAGQSGSSNVASSHQISDYRRRRSTSTRLQRKPFGGSFSVVHRSPVQRVALHERVGGLLYISNRAGQSGSSNVASSHQISDYRRLKSTWTRLQRKPFGGSFSVVHRPPAQKAVVHERVGGMLYNSNRSSQSARTAA